MTRSNDLRAERPAPPNVYQAGWRGAEPVKLALIRKHTAFLCSWDWIAGDLEAAAITLLLYVPAVHSFCTLLLVLPEAVQQIIALGPADLPRSLWWDGEAVIIDGAVHPDRIPIKKE